MFNANRARRARKKSEPAAAPTAAASSTSAGGGRKHAIDPFNSASAEISRDVTADEPSTLPKEVTDVMDSIRINWDFMSSEQFNPVPHALSLLDTGSLGLDIKKFGIMHERLEKAMDMIVNDYHQAFNVAIQTFSTVVENIGDSQKRVKEMRSDLESCKQSLQCEKNTLLALWLKSMTYKEMNRILDSIEDLNKTPERLETLIAGKFYLTAVRTLIAAIKTLDSNDCSEIGALENIRVEFDEIKNTLHETLIEELHSHIYLKSPYSLDRIGVPYTPDQVLSGSGTPDDQLVEDLEGNPESDSLSYIKMLLECLSLLGRLSDAIEIVRERIPVELYYVVERTIQEVDKRRKTASSAPALDDDIFYAPDLIGLSEKVDQAKVLIDLMSSLFTKLETILTGHKFLLEFVGSKEDRGDVYHIRDVWLTIQNEVKALLYDYLTSSERPSEFSNAVVSMNEVLKEKRPPRAKDRVKKQLFKITGSAKSDATEQLYRSFLFGEAPDRSGTNKSAGNDNSDSSHIMLGHSIGIIDKYANVVTTGHRLLVTPGPFNVLIAFKPTIAFSEKIEDYIDFPSGNFRIFLEDFVLNVFMPQMEDRVLEYFHNFLDAMMSGELRGKGDYESVGIISAGWACEEEIVNLLLQNTYYKNGIPDINFNQSLSQKETYAEMKLKKERSFHRTELIFEPRKLQALAHMHYSLDWFIAQISHLRVAERASRMISPLFSAKQNVGASLLSLETFNKLSSDSLPPLPLDIDDDVQLPLNFEMAARFDSILNYYQELSETYLFALRVEIRCHAMYYLDLAMREGNYMLADDAYEPDPYVNRLNQDLISIEAAAQDALPVRRIRFLFDGLSHLILYTLCSNLRYVRQINKYGVAKLIKNVQSIQHCLTNIVRLHEHGLDRAIVYFDLLNLSGDDLLLFMTKNPGKYSYDEYKIVLDLIFNAEQFDHSAASGSSVTVTATASMSVHGSSSSINGPGAVGVTSHGDRKHYNECLAKMKAYFVSHR